MDNFEITHRIDSPFVINIPHASIFIGVDFKKEFLLSAPSIDKFAKKMADLYADELFSGLYKKTGALIAKLSRVIVDMERFWNNKDEPMAKVGMGALYEKNGQGKIVRQISKLSRSRCRRIYLEYNHSLNSLVDECLKQLGFCLIIDCHTYPSKPRQYDLDKNGKRPEICLGSDKFHTPRLLVNIFKQAFLKGKFSVAENTPFKGTIVPMSYLNKNRNVFSIMIEVNRKLYMNERTYEKKNDFKKIASDLDGCISYGIDEFIRNL